MGMWLIIHAGVTHHVKLALVVEERGEHEGGDATRGKGQVGVNDGPVLVITRGQGSVETGPVNPQKHSTCKHRQHCPDSKVHGGNMGPIWGRQDPGGPHVGPVNFSIWVVMCGPGTTFRNV